MQSQRLGVLRLVGFYVRITSMVFWDGGSTNIASLDSVLPNHYLLNTFPLEPHNISKDYRRKIRYQNFQEGYDLPRPGIEPVTSRFAVQRAIHCTTAADSVLKLLIQ